MRVANDVQEAGRPYPGDLGNVVDEQASDAVLPEVGLHKQRIEFRAPVRPRDDGGKTHDDAVALCDEDAALRKLFERHRDRLRVREERVAIAGIAERCASLD